MHVLFLLLLNKISQAVLYTSGPSPHLLPCLFASEKVYSSMLKQNILAESTKDSIKVCAERFTDKLLRTKIIYSFTLKAVYVDWSGLLGLPSKT